MLQLSQAAYDVLKAVDVTTIVITPSATADAGLAWFDEYLKRGGCQYSDVVGYHFYVTPDPPEAMIPLVEKVKSSMRARKCESKPLWNTESGWARPKHFASEAEAAGYLMRTYPGELADGCRTHLLVCLGQPQLEHAGSDDRQRKSDDCRWEELRRDSPLDARVHPALL